MSAEDTVATAAGLRAAADAGADAVVAYCKELTEPERRALAPGVLEWFAERNPSAPYNVGAADMLAAFAVATLTELKKAKLLDVRSAYPPVLSGVLADRRPSWLETWAEDVMTRKLRGGRTGGWMAIRRLIRAGALPTPTSDPYILLMLASAGDLRREHSRPGEKPSFAELLRREGLVDYEVWRLFEVEGRVRPGFCMTYHGQGWEGPLLELAEAGDIDRTRLISANLGALAAGFSAYNNRWYIEFQRLLALDDGERRQHRVALLALLGQPDPQVVKLGLAEVEPLVLAGALGADELAAAVAPTIASLPGRLARDSLALLGKAQPGSQPASTAVALAAALRHADDAVQGKALDALERMELTDAERIVVMEAAPAVSATLAERVRALTGSDVAPDLLDSEPEVDAAELQSRAGALDPRWRTAAALDDLASAPNFDRRFLPLDPEHALVPVGDATELLDLLVQLIERVEDPNELERALDGLAAFGPSLSDGATWGTAALRKRASTNIGRSRGFDRRLEQKLAGLVLQLAGERSPPRRLKTFESARLEEIVERVRSGVPCRLLAMPSHRGGLLSPVTLAERVRAFDSSAMPLDASFALLRLVQHDREPALAKLDGVDGEVAAATRYALGAPEPIGPDVVLWAAASRARDPEAIDEALRARHGDLGPDATEPAVLGLAVDAGRAGLDDEPRLVVTCEPPARARARTIAQQPLEASAGIDFGSLGVRWANPIGRGSFAAWQALTWPSRHESYYARAVSDLVTEGNDDMGTDRFLVPLLDPDEPLGPMACALVAHGLSAKPAAVRQVAVDVCVDAVDDTRLIGPALGATAGAHLRLDLVSATRLAAALRVVGDVSDLHAAFVRGTIDAAIIEGLPPTGGHALLSAMLEFCARHGAGPSDEAAATLATLTGASKAAKAARELLALVPREPSVDIETAVFARRVERAERYQRAATGSLLRTAP